VWHLPTVYSVSVPLTEFLKPRSLARIYFGDAVTAEVQTYGYNSGNVTYTDGGAHIGKPVPCTALRYTTGVNQFGAAGKFPNTPIGDVFGHFGVATPANPRSWMALDPYVYFDEFQRPWMLYTYGYGGLGSRVAGYPMLTSGPWWFRQRCMDPDSIDYNPLDLGNPTNTNNRPDAVDPVSLGTIDNGRWPVNGQNAANVCEGPSVFTRTTSASNVPWTYLLYSRNDQASSAYGIYVRRVAWTTNAPPPMLRYLALDHTNLNAPVAEEPLVQSSRRTLSGGDSFGHGEVFKLTTPSGTQYYLVFHLRETATADGKQLVPLGGRTVFFKELTFDESTGQILPLSCDQTIPGLDVNVFLAPYVPPSSSVSGTIDPNGN
jgi:hypothetical protein